MVGGRNMFHWCMKVTIMYMKSCSHSDVRFILSNSDSIGQQLLFYVGASLRWRTGHTIWYLRILISRHTCMPVTSSDLWHHDMFHYVIHYHSRTIDENYLICLLYTTKVHTTVGKRNYFTGYGILLHKFPVVAVLFNQSNNNEEFHTSRDIL